jgi:RNA polymerase sigma factor (sigma-70 family)
MDFDDTTDVTQLVQAAVAGDHRAWEHLVDRYMPLVRSVIWSFRLPDKDAEDANQMVWLALVESLGRIREPRALPGWIVTTTRRECIGVQRRSRQSVPVDFCADNCCADDAVSVVVELDFDETTWRAERHAALLRGLAELPPRQRDLLVLLLSDPPLSYDEISALLGIPKGSIGPTRARAMRRLRDSMREFHPALAMAS